MTHNHQSKEECKHEKLTYCKECDVVECECGREWNKWKVEPITPLPSGYWQCSFCSQYIAIGQNHTCIPNVTFTCSNKQ